MQTDIMANSTQTTQDTQQSNVDSQMTDVSYDPAHSVDAGDESEDFSDTEENNTDINLTEI
jgi:hypothetical protein